MWNEVDNLKVQGRFTQLYIQGTIGYSKSHILAVLAGLLSHLGKQLLYLLNCRELLENVLLYMQSALLCTFTDTFLSPKQDLNF